MHIDVVAENTINRQACTYADYRLFAALSQHVGAERVRAARVVLRGARHQGRRGVSCTVTVVQDGGDALRIRTSDGHAYAAINRAIERLRSTPSSPYCGTAVETA